MNNNLVPIDNNAENLTLMAAQAEKAAEAAKKITKIALGVTTVNDWVDMNKNPYLGVSGAEKLAHLFGISWTFEPPICEEDADGNYTYYYTGVFTLPGRSITVEGSRSSRDDFFKQYKKGTGKGKDYVRGPEKTITERDNKRDVRMAALTNLIGNGICRLLGLRGLTYEILAQYTEITKDKIINVQYGKSSQKDYQANADKAETGGHSNGNPELLTEKQKTAIENMSAELEGLFVWETDTHLKEISKILDLTVPITAIKDLTKQQAIIIYKVLYDLIAKNKQNKDK